MRDSEALASVGGTGSLESAPALVELLRAARPAGIGNGRPTAEIALRGGRDAVDGSAASGVLWGALAGLLTGGTLEARGATANALGTRSAAGGTLDPVPAEGARSDPASVAGRLGRVSTTLVEVGALERVGRGAEAPLLAERLGADGGGPGASLGSAPRGADAARASESLALASPVRVRTKLSLHSGEQK